MSQIHNFSPFFAKWEIHCQSGPQTAPKLMFLSASAYSWIIALETLYKYPRVMAEEITVWGCPSYRESVGSQYSLTRPDLWRSSWSWPYQYSRVPHYYCERLPFPRSPVSWSARIEMISVQRETSRVSADQDGQMWSWGEQSWSAVEARPKVLESMINGWSRPKRWGIDDQLWWRKRLDKTDKVSWPPDK